MIRCIKLVAGLVLMGALLSCATQQHRRPTVPPSAPIVSPQAIAVPPILPKTIEQPAADSVLPIYPLQPVYPVLSVHSSAPATFVPAIPSPPAHSEPPRQYASFDAWKQDFMQRAPSTQAAAFFANASLNNQVMNLDNNQAEFAKMPWEYLDGAVTQGRINQGQQYRHEMQSVLSAAKQRYGVPASIVTAIWGIESSYGAVMGKSNLIDALSSLAYDGRRRAFAENELWSMLKMVQRGDISAEQLKGSWAGGMGHTQFIPSTWLAQGVDGDNDGKRSPFSRADALTSTANYLANSGFVRHLPIYVEVALPADFDYRHIGASHRMSEWQQLGATIWDTDSIPANEYATLWLPAGINGPKLLITKNFDVLKNYNNSSNYVLAVALLAKQIDGQTGIQANFPRHERPLSRQQVKQLQQRLADFGYAVGTIDGIAGSGTRRAFAKWQADNGRIADGFISQNSTAALLD